MTASPPAAPGMPSEEEIARAVYGIDGTILLTGHLRCARSASAAARPTAAKLRAAMIETGIFYEHAGALHTGIRGDEVVERDFEKLVKLLGLTDA